MLEYSLFSLRTDSHDFPGMLVNDVPGSQWPLKLYLNCIQAFCAA